MGQLYNKENKPTISCRGIELYPSTSVGEVMWAGDTLVWYKNEGPPTSLYDVVWPKWNATEGDTDASFPVHLDYLMCIGFIPPQPGPLPLSNMSVQSKVSKTNGLYLTNQECFMNGLLLTSITIEGGSPNSMGIWDIKNETQINDLLTLEDGFYPVSLWEDADYDGLFQYKNDSRQVSYNKYEDYRETYYGYKILSIGGPDIHSFGKIGSLPCSWILKIRSRFLSYAYGPNECLYRYGYYDLKDVHNVSTMEEARELEYKKMLEEAYT